MITLSLLSRASRCFLYSSVYFCHLFLISYASVMSISFLIFIVPIFPWNFSFLSTIYLKRSLPSHSTVFLYFFSLIMEGLSLLAVLWNSAFTWVYISFSPLPLSSHYLLSNTYCQEPAWGIPPVAKVMRKGAWHNTKVRSGLKEKLLGFLEHLPPKPESACLTALCFPPILLTLQGGYPWPPFSGKS